ncbi:MAG: replication restart helicase PriA [Bdellovibrionia bacterium]
MEVEADQGVRVAVPRPVYQCYTYQTPSALISRVKKGVRVQVSFGKSKTHAFVMDEPKPLSPELKAIPLKEILEVLDEDPVFPSDVFELCQWASEYYATPLGEVLEQAYAQGHVSKEFKRPAKAPQLSYAKVPRLSLNDEQNAAVEGIWKLGQQPSSLKVALLHGVTGSGKTEVYLELIERTLNQGQSVLVLVPEIALTSQLHRRFEEGLGVAVGLWHSAVSAGKRRDQLQAIKTGGLKVIVGARSAIFTPLPRLGLIVVDEEHDPTYKQEDRLGYQARDLAVVRAKLCGAIAVLGSATPSYETLERVRQGRYSSFQLTQRVAQSKLPEIRLVDLTEEPPVENIQATLAQKTLSQIQQTLARGEQVILYLNRRGFAAFLLCADCKHVEECTFCSSALTFHKRDRQLKCHTCGLRRPVPESCPKCSGFELKPIGAGTESLEEELPRLLPEVKLLRLDRDQITSTGRLQAILDAFRKQEANLLLGTQMIVKGHDFPRVTLVVVLLADGLFRWPDFRAHERAIQVLKQVAGRAGRGGALGQVWIQTYDVDHPVLKVMDGREPEAELMEAERSLRRELGYPPFGRLVRLRVEHEQAGVAQKQALEVAQSLRSWASLGVQILGPCEAFLGKLGGIYRWDLLIKSKTIEDLQKLLHAGREFAAERKFRLIVDVDPYGI